MHFIHMSCRAGFPQPADEEVISQQRRLEGKPPYRYNYFSSFAGISWAIRL